MNQKGYLTIEAAVIVPLMLLGTVLLLTFFYGLFKWSGFELIYNHQVMSEELHIQSNYSFDQLADKHTQLKYKMEENELFGVVKKDEKAAMRVDMPYLHIQKTRRVERSRYEIPVLYKVALGELYAAFVEKYVHE